MKLRTFASLVLCNLIWSAHPVMSKILMAEMPPTSASWARYAAGLLGYLLIVIPLWRLFPKRIPAPFFRPRTGKEFGYAFLTGFMAFCYSPLLAFVGLNQSHATDGAIIIAMEPLISVLLAWIFLKEKLPLLMAVAFAGAISGFALLSGVTGLATGEMTLAHLGGNALLLAALLGEASYSITGRKLLEGGRKPLAIMGTALLLGVISLTVCTVLIAPEGIRLAITGLSWKGALALLWLGPLGTTVGYMVWMFALTEATVASLALTLFVQPVFGSVWGLLFLGDRLSFAQCVGAMLILGAVSIQTFLTIREN